MSGCSKYILALILAMLWLVPNSARAKEQVWQVPIFYVTDRQPDINLMEGAQTSGFQAKRTVMVPGA